MSCYVCAESISPFMSFGPMPIANGFLSKDQFSEEYFFDMEVAFCESCYSFQLINQPERQKMFNKNYHFFSGTSKLMDIHFQEFAKSVINNYLIKKKDPFIIELGSNDGIMLKNFSDLGVSHLGVEPSYNVAKIAIDRGINTVVEFFEKSLAEKLVSEYGQADVILAANVMCHIPYISSILEGIKVILKKDGLVIFEDPYLGDVISKTTYDQIYDEHVFLFSLHSIQYLFNQIEMELIDIEPQKTHGGSMRYILANKGQKSISEKVYHQLHVEKNLGLINTETFNIFKKSCEKYRLELLGLINEIKSDGKSIAGYAATSKSTTIINYCGISTEHLDCIYDTTPSKQGKFSPGAHIPIVAHSDFEKNYPDYALLFAYNHLKEIMPKEQEYIMQGGQWISYVPKVRILD